jgi:hypothetical protein
MNVFSRKNKADDAAAATDEVALEGHEDLAAIVAEKTSWQKVFPILAAGSGLFSEGYVQSVCLLPSTCAWLRLRAPGRHIP